MLGSCRRFMEPLPRGVTQGSKDSEGAGPHQRVGGGFFSGTLKEASFAQMFRPWVTVLAWQCFCFAVRLSGLGWTRLS